ncbi:MAG: helix-turn-helix domain-containing protein [Syntrophorhabdales bacterium]|jgi:uncharacterized radical SAM superfamily protein
MRPPKIDRVKLSQLLSEGKSGKEIARLLGVSEGAISKARKELGIAVVRNVALESAPKVVDKNLNAIDQLSKINAAANEILDLLMAWGRGDDTALQVLESSIRKIKRGSKKEPEEVEEFKMKDPRELALKACAEIRGQLSLQLEIFKTLYDVEAIAEFQREVLEAIGEVSPDVRNRIVQRLKTSGSLRPSATIDRSAVSLV